MYSLSFLSNGDSFNNSYSLSCIACYIAIYRNSRSLLSSSYLNFSYMSLRRLCSFFANSCSFVNLAGFAFICVFYSSVSVRSSMHPFASKSSGNIDNTIVSEKNAFMSAL